MKLPERPDQKRCVGMSEYPCTGIDKAILKFALQDSKISQIVSVNISSFFPTFARQLLPFSPRRRPFSGLRASIEYSARWLPYEAFGAPCDVILTQKIG
jgi:hypothetical protein